jgi:hypothetical protein
MPLKSGSSKKTVSSNISEMMGAYGKTGKIGTSKPKSKKKAQKQAVAIALGKARQVKTPSTKSGVSYVLRKDAKNKTMIA